MRPEAPKHDPEQPVEMSQSGSRPLALENNQLLAQSEALKPEVMSCVEERTDIMEKSNDELTHKTWLGGTGASVDPLSGSLSPEYGKPLILHKYVVLASDGSVEHDPSYNGEVVRGSSRGT